MKFNWGTGIFLFFVVFIGLATTFIVFSFRQRIDLVTEDYYNQGAAYTTQMEINERSTVYTDSIRISTTNNEVIIQLASSLELNGSDLETYFYYPANKQNDFTETFEQLSDSLIINKSNLAKGRCLIKLCWVMNDTSFFIEQTLFIE